MKPHHRRILWLLILGSLLVDALSLSLTHPRPPQPGASPENRKPVESLDSPQLVLENPEHDFGVLAQGVSIEHIFKFQNHGGAPLHIQSLEETCGCTSALLSQDTLQPGEEGEFKVTFDSGSLEGPFRKRVTIHSNDERSPTKAVVKGAVQTLYLMDPARLLFGKVKLGQERRQLVRITPRKAGTPLNVTRVWCRNPQIRVEGLRALKSGPGFAFEVFFRPESIEDPRDGVINVETDHPDISRAWLRYTSRLEP